jgi:hypothetical protein
VALREVKENLQLYQQETTNPGSASAVLLLEKLPEPRMPFADIMKQQQGAAKAQAQAPANVQAQSHARATCPVQALQLMRRELQKIGALPPARETPAWKMVTANYFQTLSRCPVGKLRAIIRSAVHHDAAIAASFIGRNVVEVLCTRS